MINKKFTDLDGEIWVPLLRDYEISNMGRVVSNKGTYKRIMRTYLNNRDYHIIHLRINNKRFAYTVHRLVALIFLSNTDPNKTTVNHHFGKDDNKAASLSWMTQTENTNHAISNGLIRVGSKRPKARLDEVQVLTIRSLRKELTEIQLAEYFKVSRGSINSIHLRKSWRHV
jgi:hypothetical protein